MAEPIKDADSGKTFEAGHVYAGLETSTEIDSVNDPDEPEALNQVSPEDDLSPETRQIRAEALADAEQAIDAIMRGCQALAEANNGFMKSLEAIRVQLGQAVEGADYRTAGYPQLLHQLGEMRTIIIRWQARLEADELQTTIPSAAHRLKAGLRTLGGADPTSLRIVAEDLGNSALRVLTNSKNALEDGEQSRVQSIRALEDNFQQAAGLHNHFQGALTQQYLVASQRATQIISSSNVLVQREAGAFRQALDGHLNGFRQAMDAIGRTAA